MVVVVPPVAALPQAKSSRRKKAAKVAHSLEAELFSRLGESRQPVAVAG